MYSSGYNVLKIFQQEEGPGDLSYDGYASAEEIMNGLKNKDEQAEADFMNEPKAELRMFPVALKLNFAMQQFRRFLCKECSEEHLLFLYDIDSYNRFVKNPDISDAEKKEQALKLQKLYIDSNSEREVNVDSNCKKALVKSIEENESFDQIFEKAYSEVMMLIGRDSFSRLIALPIFKYIMYKYELTRVRRVEQQFPTEAQPSITPWTWDADAPTSGGGLSELVQDFLVELVDICCDFLTPFGNSFDFKKIKESKAFLSFRRSLAEFKRMKLRDLYDKAGRLSLPGTPQSQASDDEGKAGGTVHAFWVNLANMLGLCLRIIYGENRVPYKSIVTIEIGTASFTYNDIVGGILGLSIQGKVKKSAAVKEFSTAFNPRLHFTLSHFNVTSPMLRIFSSDAIAFDNEVDLVTREYITKYIKISELSHTLLVPDTLFKDAIKDFGKTTTDFANFVLLYLKGKSRIEAPLEQFLNNEIEIDIKYYGRIIGKVPSDDIFKPSFEKEEANAENLNTLGVRTSISSLGIFGMSSSRNELIPFSLISERAVYFYSEYDPLVYYT